MQLCCSSGGLADKGGGLPFSGLSLPHLWRKVTKEVTEFIARYVNVLRRLCQNVQPQRFGLFVVNTERLALRCEGHLLWEHGFPSGAKKGRTAGGMFVLAFEHALTVHRAKKEMHRVGKCFQRLQLAFTGTMHVPP